MREIGVRELKASLSATLRAVARGERVRVTTRGRAVADLVPPGTLDADDWMRRLVAEGRMTPSTRPRSAPPPHIRTDVSAAEIVLADRDAER